MALDIIDSFVKTATKVATKRVDQRMPNLPPQERLIMIEAEAEKIFTVMLEDAITKLDTRG